MTRQAFCKINLFLDVLGARRDGYHDLRMVMQTVSLCDTVDISAAAWAGFQYQTNGQFLSAGEKPLEQKAAEAFFQAMGLPMPGLRVAVDKQIPAQAGLGGGSADAAAVLRILRDSYAPELSDMELERIGLLVGSDVPFCLRGGTCLAEGRGEYLTPLPPLPDCVFVLCKPDFGLSTKALFQRLDAHPPAVHADIDRLTAAVSAGELTQIGTLFYNAFETVLEDTERLRVSDIRDTMAAMGAKGSAMSGTGPTVFGLFDSQEAAEFCVERLRVQYASTWLAAPVPALS